VHVDIDSEDQVKLVIDESAQSSSSKPSTPKPEAETV
jgi:hypothetical protein